MCLGMPPGFSSPCGIYTEPHGPHPLEQPMTRRAQVIASIHALADYLAEHPEHPTPDKIQLEQAVTTKLEVDEAMRAHMIKSWVNANGGILHQSKMNGDVLLGRVTLMSAEGFGVEVTYDRFAHDMTERHVR